MDIAPHLIFKNRIIINMNIKSKIKKIIIFSLVILGGLSSLVITKDNLSNEFNSLIINFSIFLLFAAFTAWLIYLAKNKIVYSLNYLIILISILLFALSVSWSYKLGWTETIILPLITGIFLILVSLFLNFGNYRYQN